MTAEATADLCRTYFETWTNRGGADALRPLLAEAFVFRSGPMRVEGREEFLSFAAWPEAATTRMVADAYEATHGLQLYEATNGDATVIIAEYLVVDDGRITASEIIADGGAFASFLTGGASG